MLFIENCERDDRLKAIHQLTCLTNKDSYVLKVAQRTETGFKVAKGRNLVFQLHLDAKPSHITVNGNNIKSQKSIPAKSVIDSGILIWSWDIRKQICSIIIPDNGEAKDIVLKR
jgi:hypothetical protein